MIAFKSSFAPQQKINLANHVGWSTGGIDKECPHKALYVISQTPSNVVELSALAEPELKNIKHIYKSPILAKRFSRISFHAPAQKRYSDEIPLVRKLLYYKLPMVVHADTIKIPRNWAVFENNLLIENQNRQKKIGQTVKTLEPLFESLPKAGFCFDLPHALDVGGELFAFQLAESFKEKLVQIHIGCGNGELLKPSLEKNLLSTLAQLIQNLGFLPIIIIERVTPAQLPVLLEQWKSVEKFLL